MERFAGKHEGDLHLTEELAISGMVTGSITVSAGGKLVLSGMCCESVIVEPGGAASISGTVIKNVTSAGGDLTVTGVVNGELIEDAGTTVVAPGAAIGD